LKVLLSTAGLLEIKVFSIFKFVAEISEKDNPKLANVVFLIKFLLFIKFPLLKFNYLYLSNQINKNE